MSVYGPRKSGTRSTLLSSPSKLDDTGLRLLHLDLCLGGDWRLLGRGQLLRVGNVYNVLFIWCCQYSVIVVSTHILFGTT